MNLADLKLTDVAFPVMTGAWIFRELFAFVRKDAIGMETTDSPVRKRGSRAADEDTDALPPIVAGVKRDRYNRLDIYIPAIIAIAFYMLCIVRLDVPNEQIFDEVHHARSAMEYVDGLVPHEWSHPPFSKEMIGLSLMTWRGEFNPRDGVWKPDAKYDPRSAIGWRYASVVFGTLTLPALYFLTWCLFGNRTIATSAATLLALDGAFFVQSRVAMTNIFTLFFITFAAGWLALYLRQPRLRWLLFTGATLGLAIASRWSSLYAWAVAVLLLGLRWFYCIAQAKEGQERPAKQPGFLAMLPTGSIMIGIGALCLLAVPFVFYFATYLPNMIQGDGTLASKLLTANGPHSLGWVKTFTLQHDMYMYHSTLVADHPYDSPWWSWPLMLRPVWYYFHGNNDVTPHTISGVWCIGNALIWWASVPAFVIAAYVSWKQEIRITRGAIGPLGLVAAFGLGQWLAWGIKERALNFMHYYFECIPFACVAIAYFGYRLWTSEAGGPDAQRVRRSIVAAYAAGVVLWFIFYYPLLSAYPISEWYYGQHLWLGRQWV